jgi:hypothetical protein
VSINLHLFASGDRSSQRFPLFQMNTEQTKRILAAAVPDAHRYTVYVMDAYMDELKKQYAKREDVLWLLGHEMHLMRFLLSNPDHHWTSY